ncbi:hypothetical protein F444_11705 [Phytophthora nicotianae P1976]|uniref:Uncharacterized protein n=1 Tax=Phytophthora nicotianae P1976 TaxID=1317066 RepID=A0A080ZZK3_PHYNI|nr:hypothetical protein F444_11705 [Phytophthora nicotianae P1976]
MHEECLRARCSNEREQMMMQLMVLVRVQAHSEICHPKHKLNAQLVPPKRQAPVRWQRRRHRDQRATQQHLPPASALSGGRRDRGAHAATRHNRHAHQRKLRKPHGTSTKTPSQSTLRRTSDLHERKCCILRIPQVMNVDSCAS